MAWVTRQAALSYIRRLLRRHLHFLKLKEWSKCLEIEVLHSKIVTLAHTAVGDAMLTLVTNKADLVTRTMVTAVASS